MFGAVGAVGAVVAPVAGAMAVNAASKVAGDHATWYVLTGTYNKTIETCTSYAGSTIGNVVWEDHCPEHCFISSNYATAKSLGGCVSSSVSMAGMAVLGYYTGSESGASCGAKVALGVGGTALAAFSVVNAPTIATVFTLISVGQTAYSLMNSMAAKAEIPADALNAGMKAESIKERVLQVNVQEAEETEAAQPNNIEVVPESLKL